MSPEVWTVVVAVFGALGLRELIAAGLARRTTRAAVEQVSATTAATEVETIRQVLAEVRANDAAKTERLTALEARVVKLEERERHALTRAAVHEAWDQLAFQALLKLNPEHPPPPPLAAPLPDGSDPI